MQLLALYPVADYMHSLYMCCTAYLLTHSISQPKRLSADGLLVIKVFYLVPLKCEQPLAKTQKSKKGPIESKAMMYVPTPGCFWVQRLRL